MKRAQTKNRKPGRKRAGGGGNANAAAGQAAPLDRREALRRARNWGLLVAFAGGGGWLLVDDMIATARELDLSQIGKGIPTVVQIHDPQCPRCRALQREVRSAMKAFGDDELRYLVANIRDQDGRDLAHAHRVGHVTLLLFDGEGRRRDIVVGQRSSGALKSMFRRHLSKYGPKKTG